MKMVAFTIRTSLLCFILFSLYAVSYGLGNGFGRGRAAYKSDGQKPVYNGLSYANGDYQMKQASDSKPKIEASPRRGLGLSAWGIIGIMAGVVFLGTALYFAVLFYPILCKKERKNQNHRSLDCCPTTPTAPPDVDNIPALSTPV